VSGDKDEGFNVARAELFEAMGHPNRIRIIKALAEKPLGFSELKRAVGIDSSGLLAFHLDKLTHLVATDSTGSYALTDEGREALKIIQTTTDESSPGKGGRVLGRRIERRNAILAAVVIGILVLASAVAYQQFELSGLSKANSSQSSELVSPTMSVEVSNFTVTKANATAPPVILAYVSNDGQVTASSGSFLVTVSHQGGTFQSCLANGQDIWPVFPHDTVLMFSQLTCGSLDDNVVLTAQVNFLTSNGNVTKTYNAQTTIIQTPLKPSTVLVGQFGIRTVVTEYPAQNSTVYLWYLDLTSESPTPIVSVSATLGPTNNPVGADSGCLLVGPRNMLPVSTNSPLTQFKTCQNDSNPQPSTPLHFGESLEVVVSGKYSNGTAFSVSTTALVMPPYVLFS